MTNIPYPEWMLTPPDVPENPRLEPRILHRERLNGWLGYAKLEDIEYWTENRRTDIQIARLRAENISLFNEQIVDYLLKDPDLDVKGLAQNILDSELRQPLVLSYDRELLDGNRRYLAHKWIEKNSSVHEKEKFSFVKVWVLSKADSTRRKKLRVVTEYNFLHDFKQRWNDFVKAKWLHEQYYDSKNDYSFNNLFELYGGPGFSKHKIMEFVKTYELIAEFLEQYGNDESALDIAADNFIWFQQLQRSVRDEIRNDDEFQQVVFDNIRDRNISKTDHLKNLKGIRALREAWRLFRDGEAEAAQIKYQAWKIENDRITEPDRLMDEVISRLENLLDKDRHVERISQDNRSRFHSLALKVPGQVDDALMRLDYALNQLETLTSSELAKIPPDYILRMEETLSRVGRQARATAQ